MFCVVLRSVYLLAYIIATYMEQSMIKITFNGETYIYVLKSDN